jgi:hypothetical protein
MFAIAFEGAIREALVGNREFAGQQAREALARSDSKDNKGLAAIALALAGEAAGATRLAGELARQSPEDTIARIDDAVIRAAVLLSRGSPANARAAIQVLAPAAPYDLSGLPPVPSVYMRGLACLAAHDGPAAAVQFQKVLDHAGVTRNFVAGPLAHLGLGRAYAIMGDNAKARAAYQNFLAIWKDADPDVPVLKEAKSELASLR